LGEQARQEGLVYDVDYTLLKDALVAGGLSDEDVLRYPTIIKRGDDPCLSGRCYWVHPDEPDTDDGQGSRIELYTYHGKGEITTKTVAHEARHLADAVHVGSAVFVSERARLIRKSAITVGTLALAAGYYYSLLRGNAPFGVSGLEKGAFGVADSDLVLSGLLAGEYAIRKHERRARRTERHVERHNILLVDGSPAVPISKLAIAVAGVKQLFIPNFSL
jgi:hypothetical protein